MEKNNSRKSVDRILLYSVSLLVVVMLCIQLWQQKNPYQVAYVDIGRLMDGYTLKKDLEQSSGGKLFEIKGVIDSLKLMKKTAGSLPVPMIDSQLSQASRAFDYYYTVSNKDITEKIWSRLNPLLQQYGKEKKLGVVIGADGAGNILYGDVSLDVTNEVIEYVNSKYEKGS